MRFPARIPVALVLLAAVTLAPSFVRPAVAQTSHVVISQFATRGPTAATDEFIELYNPTSSPIDMGGWKLQYKSATGSTWNDRAILPANSVIQAHGYFLIANQSYIGTVTPDYSSGLWNSGTGMADNGNEQIIDASAVKVDKIGWGTGNDPEGGVDAPNHGTSANNNSVIRKALATSTADSLFTGGAHSLLGNGWDTDVNGSDFVVQTHGRMPRNHLSPIEPPFSNGGSGTGRVTVTPATVYTNRTQPSLDFAFVQDSAYTVTDIAIQVPTSWTWDHTTGSVALTGAAFASATPSVTGDTLFVTGAALTQADGGTVSFLGLGTPASKGGATFNVRTAVSGGTLTQVALSPSVRALELVPIVSVHVNDPSTGVCTAPYAVGTEVTVSGVVTVNYGAGTKTDFYLQDGTAGIDVFNSAVTPVTINAGDSVTVTGTILQFRGITEVQPDFALLTVEATGRTIPDPMVLTCAELNATFHSDGTEPNEGRLIRVNGVTYNSTLSTITDATGTSNIFIPATYPPTPSVFDVIGILKQYKPGTPAPGPPYLTDYEITPRTPDDIIAHPGPILLTVPYEDSIQANTVRINWTTDVASSSIVRFGLTPALGDSVVDATAVTGHAIFVPGLQPATLYYYSAGSEDGAGANFSPVGLFCTASAPPATGAMNVYFNHDVNTSVAWLHTANGNADFTSLIVDHITHAQRSVDAALYNLSGTSGTAIANALIAARARGVAVRTICEYDNRNAAGFSALRSAGVPQINDWFDAINAGNGLMHDKFFVIDGRGGAPESVWVWTGSWNPTDPGTNDDFQNVIEVQDPALAVAYTIEFNEMWGSSTDTPNASLSRFGARKLDNSPHHFVIGGRKVECWFSPSDGTTYRILDQLNAAQHSIGFELLTITRTDLAGALVNQHTAGLKVRGDIDSNSDTGSQYGTLVTGGVDVHLKTGVSGLLHHKYAILDAESPRWNSTTITGSHNWSAAAENQNNENTLVVHDFDVTNQYLQEFTARYYQFGGLDSVVVGVTPGGLPGHVALSQNTPNPFRGRTAIDYAIPTAQRVSLKVYDLQGRMLQTLVDGPQAAGRYHLELSAGSMPGGVYFYRLQTGGVTRQRKMVVLQ